ncbi:MAG: ABC transporter permease [Thermoleophilaceae bacterium]|nr:ABC transporter permease [Thermoleophilaceae bacterium]
MTGAAGHLDAVGALMRRALNELLRVPGAAIPGVLAPSLFMLGLTGVFGELTELQGFDTDSFLSFILPVSLVQGATFAGAATGVNLARDIEIGWFDRLLAAPVPRPALLAGIVLSASLRSLLPITGVLVLGLALGANWPGIDGLLVAVGLGFAFASVAASWTVGLALRFKTQAAAPLMQASMFVAVLFTTSYAPQEVLTGWLATVARYNPVTRVVEGVRQGFVGEVTWSETWPALAVLVVLLALMVAFALRGLRHAGD